MMDNKLSELSKPVAWAFKDANDVEHASIIKKANLYGRHDFQPLYSQEYVSALLAELEAKDKRIAELSRLLAHNIERAEKAEKRLVYSKDAISTWERKAISNFDECATMSQRIIELEAIRSDASQVFKEIGNELGCNPDNESIMMAIDELKKRENRVVALAGGNAELWETMAARLEEVETRLATPVDINLPERRDDSYDWDGASPSDAFNTCRSICGLMFRQQLRAAGFTVEGDE
ncbi:hypothetical protein [Serratia nevei]|uniref:hypothetical protein n=1 Tax=Serratia nevei TaxID=2703794 RepID=UPI00335FAF72